MKRSLLLYIITLILIPIFVISIIFNLSSKEKILTENKSTTEKTKKYIKIKINKNNNIIELDLEDYIIGVIAGEMPASFELEALKAQAVASRTYAIYKMENNKNIETTTDDQVYITETEMKEKWQDEYDFYYKKIKQAVSETKHQIMTKDNKVFKSYYFAMSNGYTEDSITVFGDTTTKSVSSPWDNETLNKFIVSTEFTEEELKTKLNITESIKNITITKTDKNNRVNEIKVNNIIYTGIEFRKKLNLRSTDFKVEQNDNKYIITTRGYGHGVGMSQYGANGMAKENYTYKEILEYYYQNIKIKEI